MAADRPVSFEIEGRVEHGDQRGRTIGFPTANVAMGEYTRPRLGVYAIRAGIDRHVAIRHVATIRRATARTSSVTPSAILRSSRAEA